MKCLACNASIENSRCGACGREYLITRSPHPRLFAIPKDERKLARFFGIFFATQAYVLYTDGSGLLILRNVNAETIKFVEDLLLVRFFRPPTRPIGEFWVTNIGLVNWLVAKLKLKRRLGKRSFEPSIVPEECMKFPEEFKDGLRINSDFIMPYRCCAEFIKREFGWLEKDGIFDSRDVSN